MSSRPDPTAITGLCQLVLDVRLIALGVTVVGLAVTGDRSGWLTLALLVGLAGDHRLQAAAGFLNVRNQRNSTDHGDADRALNDQGTHGGAPTPAPVAQRSKQPMVGAELRVDARGREDHAVDGTERGDHDKDADCRPAEPGPAHTRGVARSGLQRRRDRQARCGRGDRASVLVTSRSRRWPACSWPPAASKDRTSRPRPRPLPQREHRRQHLGALHRR